MTDLNESPPKRRRGRPPTYSQEYCEKLLDLMEQGYLNCQIYAEWGIHKDTFYTWINTHPEFKEAYDQGLPLVESAWIDIGKRGMLGQIKGFNFPTWIAILNNKFGWQRGTSDHSTQININQLNYNQQSDTDLIQLVQNKLKEHNIIDLNDSQFRLIEAQPERVSDNGRSSGSSDQ